MRGCPNFSLVPQSRNGPGLIYHRAERPIGNFLFFRSCFVIHVRGPRVNRAPVTKHKARDPLEWETAAQFPDRQIQAAPLCLPCSPGAAEENGKSKLKFPASHTPPLSPRELEEGGKNALPDNMEESGAMRLVEPEVEMSSKPRREESSPSRGRGVVGTCTRLPANPSVSPLCPARGPTSGDTSGQREHRTADSFADGRSPPGTVCPS